MTRVTATLLVVTLLAGCATSSARGPGAADASGTERTISAAAAERPKAKTGGPRAPARIDMDPNQLLDTEQTAVSSLLGTPGYERHEQDAKVWQYRSGRCVLDVFLYRGSGNIWRVAYYEFRSPDVGPVSAGDCFEMLIRENAATVESRSSRAVDPTAG